MTIFFSETGVPVLPWYAALNETLPWVPPPQEEEEQQQQQQERGGYVYGDKMLREPWP